MADHSLGDLNALIERARGGEQFACRELFRLHVRAVHRLVYRLAGPGADVEDLVQLVFWEGFRSLPSFRGDALFTTWLGRIAVRVALRAQRRPRLRIVPLAHAGDRGDERPSADESLATRERLARLDALLAALKPKKRAAFVLHCLEGHSLEETAAIVDASPAAVKAQVRDARRLLERRARKDPWLAELLGDDGGTP